MSEDVYVNDTGINVGGQTIDFDRCDTPEKILTWVYLFCERDSAWITPEMISEFIVLASKRIDRLYEYLP